MAKNLTIAGADYPAVPSIKVPITGGGTAEYFDGSDATATAAYIAKGKKAVTGSGLITGTAELVYTAATESLTLPSWVVTLA